MTKQFILIMADTVRKDMLGCYGNPNMHTPNIDRLCAQGIRYDNAYSFIWTSCRTRTSYVAARARQPFLLTGPRIKPMLTAAQTGPSAFCRKTGELISF